jgi:hypothetical protein
VIEDLETPFAGSCLMKNQGASMEETKEVNLEDIYAPEVHDGEELDEEDYDELLCNCQYLLETLSEYEFEAQIEHEIRVILERLNEALGYSSIH